MNVFRTCQASCTIKGMDDSAGNEQLSDGAEIGKRLYTLRKGRKLSYRQLALKAQVSFNYINMLEKGQVPYPSIGMVRRLADALGVPLAELAGDSELEEQAQQMRLLIDPSVLALEANLSTLKELDEEEYDLLVAQITARIEKLHREQKGGARARRTQTRAGGVGSSDKEQGPA